MSALGSQSVFSISQTSLTEFGSNCPGLLDDKYNINGVLLQEQVVKAADMEERTKEKNRLVPDSVIRHQFLNLLVKIAKDKYLVRNKIFENLLEAFDFSITKHYIPSFIVEDPQNWRLTRYYNERVDNVIKAYLPLLDGVYRSNSSRKDPSKT